MVSLTLTNGSEELTPELYSRKQRSIADIFWYIQSKWLIEEDDTYIYLWEKWISVDDLLSDIE
jgi:hypothetical protein